MRDVRSEKRRKVREAEPGQITEEILIEGMETEKGTTNLSITQDTTAVQVDGNIP